jgi:hypothetical protein
MSLYKQQREQVKMILMDTAILLFKEKEYDSVSVEEITKKVGVAKGTFYNFFSSKRDILMCWSEKQFQKMDFNSFVDSKKSIEENLFELIDMLVYIIKEEQILFVTFLRELMQAGKEINTEGKFDFKQILNMVVSNSRDHEVLGDYGMDLKIKVLNNALFYEILEWFYFGNPADGLDKHLKNIVKVCLFGVLKNMEGLI